MSEFMEGKLIESLLVFPKMLELRPILVNQDPVDGRFASISMCRLVTLYVPTPGNGSGESNVTCVSAVSVAKVCARGLFCVGMRVLFEATMRMPSRMMKMGRLTISRLPRLKAPACCTSDVRC